MKIEISLDPLQKEPTVTIAASEITEEVSSIIALLRSHETSAINGYTSDGIVERLQKSDILRIYTERQSVLCETARGCFHLRKRLYELEKDLGRSFIRISNSEIVNIHKILRLDATLSGTIAVYLENDIKTFASRRYVRRIKEQLGI